MSDERTREVAVSTIRERAEDDDVDVSEDVLTAIEDRADDGRLALDALAEWHRTCREAHRTTAADVDAAESQFHALRESIDPVDRDTNQVRARVEEYDDQFDAMRSALATTADRLESTPERPAAPLAAYETAAQLQRAEHVVHEVGHSLHHVEEGLETFEAWLHEPAVRLDEFGDELEGFERYLDNTEELLDRLEADGDADEPFDAWLAAHHLQRMMALVFEELRADLAELETWLEERDGDHGDEVERLRDRLDELAARHEACSDRLDAAAAGIEGFDEKRAAVADSLAAFELELDDREPPVDWEAVEELMQSQFAELGIRLR